jgi:hypothetical protein
MPPKRTTNIELSDSELDELLSDDEEERKPEAGPYGGAITKPRHVTTSCKQLHGELSFVLFSIISLSDYADLQT